MSIYKSVCIYLSINLIMFYLSVQFYILYVSIDLSIYLLSSIPISIHYPSIPQPIYLSVPLLYMGLRQIFDKLLPNGTTQKRSPYLQDMTSRNATAFRGWESKRA